MNWQYWTLSQLAGFGAWLTIRHGRVVGRIYFRALALPCHLLALASQR